MKEKVIAAITALAVSVLVGASPTSAEQVTCETITVTADPGTRVIVGPDGEPPYEVLEGTATFGFNSHLASHTYTVQILDLTTGDTLSFTSGSVEACVAEAYPVAEEGYDPFPVSLVEPESESVLDLTTWQGVALAPPW